jgi:membrane fusion protein, heavy metal efflux system
MARANISNEKMLLKPDMLITILLEARPEKVVAVPASAVVRENNADHVFVKTLKDKQYKLLPVTLGRIYQEHREVLQGLQPGDQIVLDGAFHVNNERKRKEME